MPIPDAKHHVTSDRRPKLCGFLWVILIGLILALYSARRHYSHNYYYRRMFPDFLHSEIQKIVTHNADWNSKDIAHASQQDCTPMSLLNQRRQERIKSICKTFDHSKYFTERKLIYGMIENSLMKMFFCRINKAGITSAMHFFSSMNRDRALPFYSPKIQNDSVSLHLRRKDHLKGKCNHGLGMKHHSNGTYKFITGMSLQSAAHRYRNFHKLLIVRHPLQRLVSAYYQILKNGRKSESFRDFVKYEALRGKNIHWLDYQSSCHPCVMGFDFILQQENINLELPYFSNHVGLNPYYPYPRERVNDKVDKSNVYRYDEILRDLEKDEPDLFRQIVDQYQVDMDMFGYYWKNHTSGRLHDGRIC